MFKKYPKIKRLGTSETEGILNGLCYIQEKIDGANASIWVEDSKICCGSRNNKLTSDVKNPKEGDNHFNGLISYIAKHEGIQDYLKDNPTHRLYGEWLVKHTLTYKETAYKEFYLFDIEFLGMTEEEWHNPVAVKGIAEEYGIKYAEILAVIKDPHIEELNELAGKSVIGDKGEGVVIKNMDFINQWGNQQHGKIVTKKFKEDNAICFGGNNKHSDTYLEQYFVNKFMTLPRVKKIIQKIEKEKGAIVIEDTARVINTSYYDMLEEEFWTIAKTKKIVNFRNLQNIAIKKARQIFFDILNDSISVTDEK